jgi:hypothetical protein
MFKNLFLIPQLLYRVILYFIHASLIFLRNLLFCHIGIQSSFFRVFLYHAIVQGARYVPALDTFVNLMLDNYHW